MLTPKTFIFYQKYFIYFAAAFISAYIAGITMLDDGLRHIAFAAYPEIMKSWADVFPHSLFMSDYDPWHIWHSIIYFYLQFVPYDSVHIAINTTSLFFMMVLIDTLLNKYSQLKISFGLSILIVLFIVFTTSNRYINVRPDLLSGLYLMAALSLTRHWLFLFLLTLFYVPSYYLFFLYTGSMGLVYLVLKEHKAFFAVFIASCIGLFIHLYIDGSAFVQTVLYLLNDQSLRSGLEVGEGVPLFNFLKIFDYKILVLILAIVISTLIYKNYNYFKQQPLALLLIITSILWITQIRYFVLLSPLIMLYFIIEIKPIVQTIFSQKVLYYIFKLSYILNEANKKPLFYIIAISFTILMSGFAMQNNNLKTALETKKYFKSDVFNNKRILFNPMAVDI